jgi:hypothetical protein
LKKAATGFEPMNSAFAERCLTTWLRRQCANMERETGFEPATSTLARLRSTIELFPLLAIRIIEFALFVNTLFVPGVGKTGCWAVSRALAPARKDRREGSPAWRNAAGL